MRKLTAISVTLAGMVLFMAPLLFAEQNMGIMGWGVKGGLSESKFTGKDATSIFGTQKYRASGAAGAFATYRINDLFAASLEPMWVERGSKYDVTESDGTHTFSTRIDYIDVPLLAKLYIPTKSNFKPDIFAGPDVAFRLTAKAKETAPGFTQTTDIKNNIKSTDFGIAFGLGTSYDLSRGAVTLDARYYAGLTKIDNTVSNATVRNGDFLVLVGYSFK